MERVLNAAGDLRQKIVINTTNRFDGKSAGQDVIRLAQNTRIVKAFNGLAWEVLSKPQFGAVNATVFITGDDVDAKKLSPNCAVISALIP